MPLPDPAVARRRFLVASAAMTVLGSAGRARGDTLDADTVAHAEALAGVSFTPEERAVIAGEIADQVERFQKRRAWSSMPETTWPALTFNPVLAQVGIRRATTTTGAWTPRTTRKRLPVDETQIAFASLADLSHWISTRQISSVDLTKLYLDRLERYDAHLECVITLMPDHALEQARRADDELARGIRRSALHGIPWGAKDLFDTAGVRTTWGAAPFRDRVPETSATVVNRLDDAGAVLVAKLTLGALAYGDRWFGGRTNSPWNVEVGSSGSSAGSAAATAAGLVGFALGTETYGSIVSPCLNCGCAGLRPTFGRVPRDGAMALCWSLDKIGPICRHVEDLVPVLQAINGHAPGDPSSVTRDFDIGVDHLDAAGLRLGYDPAWFEGWADADERRTFLEAFAKGGVELVEITMPDLPWDVLLNVLLAEASAAFEDITLDGRDDQLVWQDPEAWPNTFRSSWFIPAPELVQTDRFRRIVMETYAEVLTGVDALVCPPYEGGVLLATNCTGHPALAVPVGIDEQGMPLLITLIGRLFDEGTILRLGREIEARRWGHRRPTLPDDA